MSQTILNPAMFTNNSVLSNESELLPILTKERLHDILGNESLEYKGGMYSSFGNKKFSLRDNPPVQGQNYLVYQMLWPENAMLARNELALFLYLTQGVQDIGFSRLRGYIDSTISTAVNERIDNLMNKLTDTLVAAGDKPASDIDIESLRPDRFYSETTQSQYQKLIEESFSIDLSSPQSVKDTFLSFVSMHQQEIEDKMNQLFPSMTDTTSGPIFRPCMTLPTIEACKRYIEFNNKINGHMEGDVIRHGIIPYSKFSVVDRYHLDANIEHDIEATPDPMIRSILEETVKQTSRRNLAEASRFDEMNRQAEENRKKSEEASARNFKAFEERMRKQAAQATTVETPSEPTAGDSASSAQATE